MGALVTVNPSAGPAAPDLPWIVTIGPLGDEEDWEPVLCGPYERQHALALARAVVIDDDLMAVVEPVQPYVSVEQVRTDIAAARAAAEEHGQDLIFGESVEEALADAAHHDPSDDGGREYAPVAEQGAETAPSAAEIRAGFARIAKRLTSA